MPDIPVLKDGVDAVVAAVGLIVTIGGGARWLFRTKLPKLREKRAVQRATDDVIRGRAAVPQDPITGEAARDAIPPLGERLAAMAQMLTEIHHELHPNGGSSMKDSLTRVEARVETIDARVETVDRRVETVDRRLENGDRRFARIEHVLEDELHTANDAVANAAEAAAHLLPVVHDAIKAQPPEE